MVLELKKTQKEEIDYLTKLENTSFEVNAKYFENGVFPPLPEEDEKKYSFRALYEKNDTEALTIFYEGEIAGSVIVKDIKPETKEILLFFIAPQMQGKNLGQNALKMVEELYPGTRTWRLVTPTQVLRNSVFYINKCGYSIVRVDEWDKDKECGMFVFEKKCEGMKDAYLNRSIPCHNV